MRTPTDALDALEDLPDGPAVLRALRAHPRTWLVGGAVRDLLLGREPRELDLVFEGDRDALLGALGATLTEAHERFGTAAGVLPGGTPVDLAHARTERYAAPGALPDVEPATLEEDLVRRDVTVNALALDGDGVLFAVPGAQEDLAAGVLRVLHDRSFTDDATRLWRVARYAARLGFTVDPHTADLARRADPRTVSGPRHGAELRLALGEPDPCATLAATQALAPRLLPAGFDPHPRALAAALDLLPDEPGVRPDLVTLAACCAAVDAATLVAWLEDLGLPAAERDVVGAGSRASTAMPLRFARTPSEIARAARGVPVEVVALAGGEQARRYLQELRGVALEISGDDLLHAGLPQGPDLGRRLARVLDAKLDGAVSGRDAELAAALEDA